MQRISETKRIDQRAKLNVFGAEVYLTTPVTITGAPDNPNSTTETHQTKPGIHSFSDGVLPPCTTIGYDLPSGTYSGTIRSLYQLAVDIFHLDQNGDDEAIKMFINYLYDVAAQLQLEILELENGMVIVSHLLHDIAKNSEKTWDELQKDMENNRDFHIATGSMGGATLLAKAVEFGSQIYDKFNYDNKISEIVQTLCEMSKVGADGNAHTLSITDIDNVFSAVKTRIYIAT